VARKQLQSVGAIGTRSAAAASQAASIANGSGAADANAGDSRQQARSLQDRVRADAARALQQGTQRNEGADR
jgi:hypothetical protein